MLFVVGKINDGGYMEFFFQGGYQLRLSFHPAVGCKHGVKAHHSSFMERNPVIGEDGIRRIRPGRIVYHGNVDVVDCQQPYKEFKFLQGLFLYIIVSPGNLKIIVHRGFGVKAEINGFDH